MDEDGIDKKQIDEFLKVLRKKYEENANPEYAIHMKKYMRDLYDYYGIRSEIRREIQKELISQLKSINQEQLIYIINQLWNLNKREFQYTAMDICGIKKNLLNKNIIDKIENLIISKSWWDTVDFLAPNCIGTIFRNNPEIKLNYIGKWVSSDNLWLKRACLIFQLKYKNKTDKGLLFNLCTKLSKEQDFFIKKAIGWALREYSKVSPLEVKSYIENHSLSNLSIREGMKIINKRPN